MKYAYVFGLIFLCLVMFSSTVHAQQENSEMQDLLNRIDELEKQLKKIDDENKARKKLEVTEEEKGKQEKEVLEAVSRDYTLEPRGTLGLDYILSYGYTPSEEILTTQQQLELRRTADHTITHSISTTYSILDNLATNTDLPIVYRYNKRGTDQELDQTDIGDISIGAVWQPIKSKAGDIRTTVSLGAQLPTGRSPYKINSEKELSTGNGYYSLSAGANFSKQVDPVVVFWSLGYGYPFKLTGLDYRVNDQVTLEEVETGDSFSFGGGLGYALSYATTINMSFSYKYTNSTTLKYKEITKAIKTGDSVSASFGIGMGWRVSQKLAPSFSLSYSLTQTAFSLSVRIPFTFVM